MRRPVYTNKLTSIPDSIGSLTALTALHFIFVKKYLKAFNNIFRDLNYNQLTSIPKSIGNLTLLETL